MVILHIYSGNLFGGVERMLISLADVGGQSDQHSFALCFEGQLSAALSQLGAQTQFLNNPRLRNPLSILRSRKALKRTLDTRRFDRVICHGIWSYCMFAPTIRNAGHSPILYLHDAPDARNAYYRWAWRNPPRLCIANSEYTRGLVNSLRPTVPVEVVHPLVNPPLAPQLQAISALRTDLGATQDNVVILLASRFDPLKGHRNLLHALHALRDRPQWRCWIAGAPQRAKEILYKEELLKLIAELGLRDRVTLIGHRNDMDKVLAACDIYCQPNETPETFGMVFVEALYAGKPVVGSALGGTLEIVLDECGTLCATEPAALSKALAPLIERPELRVNMGKSGPTRAAMLCSAEQFFPRLRHALHLP